MKNRALSLLIIAVISAALLACSTTDGGAQSHIDPTSKTDTKAQTQIAESYQDTTISQAPTDSKNQPLLTQLATTVFDTDCQPALNDLQTQLKDFYRLTPQSATHYLTHFDRLYYQLIQKASLYRTLSQLHPNSDQRALHQNCANLAMKLNTQLFKSPALYEQLQSLKISDAPKPIKYYHKKLLAKILNRYSLPNTTLRSQLDLINSEIILAQNKFKHSMQEYTRSIGIYNKNNLNELSAQYQIRHNFNEKGIIEITTAPIKQSTPWQKTLKTSIIF